MIERVKVLVTDSVVPYRNLAIEEYLFETLADSECVLYLWQNFRTVVIGRNQNAFKECKTEQLAADGGYLVRRLSGGGSVYHDLGNLNFTFLANEPDYDVGRQLSVILKALAALGIKGEKTGRNDLCVNGRKFSGNAFYKHNGRCFHHGTILVDADMENMSRYLNVSTEKLKAHSVTSTKSRVVNLKEFNAGMDIADLKAALVNAFAEVYAEQYIETLSETSFDRERLEALTEKYASEEWRFGKNMKAGFKIGRRFPWGEVDILLNIRGGYVEDAQVFTDALDDRLADLAAGCLKGARFHRDDLIERLIELKDSRGDGTQARQNGLPEGTAGAAGVLPQWNELSDMIEWIGVQEI